MREWEGGMERGRIWHRRHETKWAVSQKSPTHPATCLPLRLTSHPPLPLLGSIDLWSISFPIIHPYLGNTNIPFPGIEVEPGDIAEQNSPNLPHPFSGCTGLGFITSHRLREYEVKKLRSPALCG